MAEPEHEPDPLAARDDDPRLSVHGLSEFVFCPRAGLCLHEQEGEFEEQERKANLSYLPVHERDELERRLKGLLIQLWNALLAGVVGALLCGFAAWGLGLFPLGLAAVAIGLLGVLGAVERGYRAYVITQYLAIWRAAKPRLPDPDSTKTQNIHWCELLAAGFTIVEPPAAYTHGPWKLGGTPWRILHYGDFRIPVFLHRAKWQGLFPQHFVRMAAYCRLLEACEGFRSPYGVVVQVESFAAVTVPNSRRTREALTKELADARNVIREAEEMNVFPPSPDNAGVCTECHCGRPRVAHRRQPFTRYGVTIPIRATKKHHSHCGDRFHWIPPHHKAMAMGLVAE